MMVALLTTHAHSPKTRGLLAAHCTCVCVCVCDWATVIAVLFPLGLMSLRSVLGNRKWPFSSEEFIVSNQRRSLSRVRFSAESFPISQTSKHASPSNTICAFATTFCQSAEASADQSLSSVTLRVFPRRWRVSEVFVRSLISF